MRTLFLILCVFCFACSDSKFGGRLIKVAVLVNEPLMTRLLMEVLGKVLRS
ncbi:hypothetical protein [Borrelia anserina]|uniref:Basic membrane protein A n=1 Tax=Borrelia anserina BA2 TaxID=1313293 RepID=W5STM0_BORAN|nr:hypothetical protein [Borrelia anserina]AHH08351.1 Basic membrane protein A precursor [Borrelia anserina BA2]